MQTDGSIIIGTEIDTKSFEEQIKQTEAKLESLSKSYQKALNPPKGMKVSEQKLQSLRVQIEQTTNKLNDLRKRQAGLGDIQDNGLSRMLSNLGIKTKGLITQTIRWGLALFGIRSIYGMLSSSASTLSQYNEQIGVDMQYIRFALATTLQPIIEYLIQLAYKLLSLVNAIAQAWFGVNIFARATTDNFNKASKSLGGASKSAKELKKQLTGFDEMNVLQENGNVSPGGGGGGVSLPSFDLSEADMPNINIITGWIDKVKTLFTTKFLGIKDNIKRILLDIGFSKRFVDLWGASFDALILIVQGTMDIIKGIIEIFFGVILGDSELVKQGIIDILTGIMTIITGVIQRLMALTMMFTQYIWDTGYELGQKVAGLIKKGLEFLSNFINKGIEKFNIFKDKIVNVWANIRDKIKGFITDIQNWLTNKFGTIGTKIGNVIGSSISGIINSILSFAESRINGFLRSINNAIGVVNKIPGVSISKLSMVSFPRLAKGGILNRPGRGVPVGGAIAGEAGREFYMPLQDEQMLNLVGQAIGKYITINANITNTMNGRVISRELQRINNESDFAYNR